MKFFKYLFFYSVTFIFCINSFCQSISSTKGTDFWFGFMENLSLNLNGNPKFYVIVSADDNTNGKISIPNFNIEIDFSLLSGETKEILLPEVILYKNGSDVVSDFGVNVNSNKPISLKIVHDRGYFTESSIVYPIQMSGTKFHVLTRKDASGQNPNSFLIVSHQNNTKIVITPSVITLALKPANKSFTIELQKGQTYQIQSIENLSQSTIESLDGKKISIFCGAGQAFINDSGCSNTSLADNHLFEQILPIQYAANEFVFVPLALKGGDPLSFLILEDNTTIKFNGIGNRILKKGKFDTTLRKPTILTSNKPIFIAQFSKSLFCGLESINFTGDPSLFYVQPTHFKGYNECFKTIEGMNASPIKTHFVQVICLTSDTQSFLLDNVHPKFGFKIIPYSNNKYAYTYLNLSNGSHCIKSDYGFNAYAYGYGLYNAYTYNIGFKTNVAVEVPFYKQSIFPNPTNKNLKISYTIPKGDKFMIKYEMYDAIAKKITEQTVTLTNTENEIVLNLESLAAACYFLRITEIINNKSYVHKIIKL